jgi:hypothetical protein
MRSPLLSSRVAVFVVTFELIGAQGLARPRARDRSENDRAGAVDRMIL